MRECITALSLSLFLLLASCSSNIMFNQKLLVFADFHNTNILISKALPYKWQCIKG